MLFTMTTISLCVRFLVGKVRWTRREGRPSALLCVERATRSTFIPVVTIRSLSRDLVRAGNRPVEHGGPCIYLTVAGLTPDDGHHHPGTWKLFSSTQRRVVGCYQRKGPQPPHHIFVSPFPKKDRVPDVVDGKCNIVAWFSIWSSYTIIISPQPPPGHWTSRMASTLLAGVTVKWGDFDDAFVPVTRKFY